MKICHLLLAFVCMYLPFQSSLAEIPKNTHDGRAGTICPHWPRHPEIQLCSPSLIRLIARGEDYDGKYLEVSGYLRKSGSIFYLCPAQSLCEDEDWSAAVQLPNSSVIVNMEKKGSSLSRRITVIGKYSATTRGRSGQISGVFLTIETAYYFHGP